MIEINENLIAKNSIYAKYVNDPFVQRQIIFLLSSVIGSYCFLCIVASSASPFISNQANAWSSISYALIEGPGCVRLPLFILSVASFNLWSHSIPVVNFIDVTCIYWTILVTTIAIYPDIKNVQMLIWLLNTAFMLYIFTIVGLSYTHAVLMYYKNNLIIITGLVYGLCGINMSVFYIRNPKFLIGIGVISIGFICKLLTIFNDQYWGTSIFHLTSAIGIGILLQISKLKHYSIPKFVL